MIGKCWKFGDNVNTDEIIPGRHLNVTGQMELAAHCMEGLDPQFARRAKAGDIIAAGRNFGCGSSREHAPQAIMRYGTGIRAIVGESFAEIFYGNCLALGVPCPRLRAADVEALMSLVEREPATEVRVDLQEMTVAAGGQRYRFEMPEGARQQLLKGRWDTVSELLAAEDRVRALAATLPYLRGFA